ncbi:chromosome segregation protein SMC [Nitrosomonas sp.]|uniref:chromosome segregation protein SMC n=1 Tax=Nitrosomonas sp. TaxID=42353 RepID=UPI0020827607|nr:chromosome segregation protein SMC [Nitrosomonas sp.]GJL74865.1 MAG: chromosome partition protein Smc [Nitrosomonas sp.]
MRLVKIKLAGFKSFVEPTVIPITHNLVGIVGPNGCGKSNIIDAVRWVLGESKASTLRGESMQDVIFGGSENRKAVGRASVELFFDNSFNNVAGAWSSYTEIAIKRIIQRDGNSNYYINNIHVRRRDITDLFLGTGVGGRGYAIIEQGMISRIIEAKPQELKTFLEEAAGISKYRERRHETELRLTDTRKNLNRIEDISSELKNQIERLKNQAKVASEYTALNIQLQETQQVLWLQHRVEATKQRLAVDEEIESLEQTLETEVTQLQLVKEQRENTRVHEQNRNENLHTLQGKLYEASAEKTRLEQEITQFHKNKEQLFQQIQNIEKQLMRNQQQLNTAMENLQHWHAEKENAQSVHENGVQKNKAHVAKLPELEAIFNQCQKTFDTAQQNLIFTEQAGNLAKTHIQHANKAILQLESRNNRLQKEFDSLDEPDHQTLKSIQSKLEQTHNELTENQSTLLQTETAFTKKSRQKDKAASHIHELQTKLSHLQARFHALQNLQQKIENNEALTSWLQKHELRSLPRLWHHIQVDKDWENALESVLQARLNSLGFPQIEIINDWENDLPPGKLTIFEYQNQDNNAATSDLLIPTNRHTQWTALTTFLACADTSINSVINDWLKNIYVVDSIQAGLLQRHRLKCDESFVTREGHILNRNSVNFHSPDSQLHGVLSRQHELNQLQAEIVAIENELKVQQSDFKEIAGNHETLNQTIQLCRNAQQQLTQQRHHLQLEKIKLSQFNEQVEQRRVLIKAELDEIRQQLTLENQQKENAEKEAREHLNQTEEIEKCVQATKKELATVGQQLTEQRLKIEKCNKELQEAVFNEKICQNKINDIESSIKTLEENKVHLSKIRDNSLLENDNQDDATLNSMLETCISRCKDLEQKVVENRSELEKTRQQTQQIENKLMTSERRQASLRESINQLYLNKQAFNLLEERYNEQLREAHADEASLMFWVNKKSITALQSEINRTQKKIAALGSVNLAALKELEALQERETVLTSQTQDLKEAIVILENAIEKIDQETKKRLQQTFNAVNDSLKEIFPIIFSGGKAQLVFSDGKILESGLTLTAQPPGKKNSSIHLLSGGEKALTALALIFSLFRLNPAPFCLLDEVDAPLDDSNTGRFCELVKKLSQRTQFLFISHNKITMEIAQQLIGITMQDQGVSRVVAVDIANTVNPDNEKDTAFS